jgi:hypothetical protein
LGRMWEEAVIACVMRLGSVITCVLSVDIMNR